ncbi:hypothetical protein JTB14_027479 [Gonioctena quinquepunctata]|nr:hypothetical protein JTB14_027479 [Gonioctena quinquepunctata]
MNSSISAGNLIVKQIINNVSQSEYVSKIFDETTDISYISQMSLVLRYMGQDDGIREDFISFVDCHVDNFDESTTEPSPTGKILAQTILKFMNKYGLNLNNCVGIGTDTCSVMLSEQKSAVSELQKYLPNSMECLCHSHSLNLSISKSTSVQDMRNSVVIMEELIAFLNASSKRKTILNNSSEQLKKLCETVTVTATDCQKQFATGTRIPIKN